MPSLPSQQRQSGRSRRPAHPNVLLIVADQLRPDILPSYGGQICRTPALAQLASDSVVFDRAYTPLAVCSPARASLLTGQYPQHHGVASNEGRLLRGTLPDQPTLLSRQLEALGYDRWYGGKWHLGGSDNLPRDLGLPGHQFPGHGGGGYRYPEYRAYLERHGLEFAYASGPHQLGLHHYATLAGTAEVETSAFLAESAVDFLHEWGRRKERPFVTTQLESTGWSGRGSCGRRGGDGTSAAAWPSGVR